MLAFTTEFGKLFQIFITRAEKKNVFVNHNETYTVVKKFATVVSSVSLGVELKVR